LTNTVSQKTKKEVTLTLEDGGAGDHDTMANGVIVDPSGPGLKSTLPEHDAESSGSITDGSGGGAGCSLNHEADFGLEWMLLVGTLSLLHSRKRSSKKRPNRGSFTSRAAKANGGDV